MTVKSYFQRRFKTEAAPRKKNEQTNKQKIYLNKFAQYFGVFILLFFCALVHRLAVRITQFSVLYFDTICYTDPGTQL